MNSRERVLQSMNFIQPDRVPIDFGGHRSSGIMAIAYRHLRDYLGLPQRVPKVYDLPQQLAIIEDDVLDCFNVDVIDLGRGFSQDDSDWKPWILPDGSDCLIPAWLHPVRENDSWVISGPDGTPIGIQKKGMLYFEQTYWPLKESPESKLDHLETVVKYNMWMASTGAIGPFESHADGLEFLSEHARRLRKSCSRAIIGLFAAPLLEGGQQLFGMEEFYIQLSTNPKLVNEFFDKSMACYLRDLEFYLKAVGPYIDILLFSDDLGMQTGPQISPKMFREFVKPRQKELWARAKKLAPVKIMLHSCGSISHLLPDLIDSGLDAINPVQISARDMEPSRLKSEFGRQIVFWGGGCDTQYVLPDGSPEEIKNHVFDNLRAFAQDGGYVFHQVHNIMADVAPQNIVAMFDAVKQWNDRCI